MTHDALDSIPLFATLSPQDRAALAALLVPRDFPAGGTILRMGGPGGEMFVVHSGRVSIAAGDPTGSELGLGILRPGAFFGEISLLDGGPRTATARAIEPVRLLVLAREDFFSFLERHPKAARHIVEVVTARQREMVQRVLGIRNVNEAVEERSTKLDKLIDGVAALVSNRFFILGNVTFLGGWIAWNLWTHVGPISLRDEPPTFYILCFLIGLESILLTIFVLATQRRSAERARIQADLEYHVNVEAHREVVRLHQKIDRLGSRVDDLVHKIERGDR
jgi:CRP/FNR family transcriptional regulator, cyclic AMP receptor protein